MFTLARDESGALQGSVPRPTNFAFSTKLKFWSRQPNRITVRQQNRLTPFAILSCLWQSRAECETDVTMPLLPLIIIDQVSVESVRIKYWHKLFLQHCSIFISNDVLLPARFWNEKWRIFRRGRSSVNSFFEIIIIIICFFITIMTIDYWKRIMRREKKKGETIIIIIMNVCVLVVLLCCSNFKTEM